MPTRFLRDRLRFYSDRIWNFVMHEILHADDPPHRLALGAAIGMFVAFTPTIGFQTAIVLFAAWRFRANKAIGLPIVWISNPATAVPIYYGCFVVGRFVLGREGMGSQWWSQLSSPPAGWWPMVSFYWSQMMEIATPVWLGSMVVGLAAAVPCYYGVKHAIRLYRLKRWGQLIPPKSVTKVRAVVSRPDIAGTD